MTKEAIIIFTRIPIPNKTKTRLMPCYTGLECAKLHACFLKDILMECEKAEKDIYIFYEDSGTLSVLENIIGNQFPFFAQEGADLGTRMHNAIEKILSQDYKNYVLIGTDIPELKSKTLEDAFLKLKESDVVLGPTYDGGYYLIGGNQSIPEAFDDIEYGNETVIQSTTDHLIKSGYKVILLDKICDVDTPNDVLQLRTRDLQNFTGHYLKNNPKISVIIPIYNESSTIHKLLDEIKKLQDCEIIFVDGGSTDDTLEIIGNNHIIISSQKGRANQMNAGALASNGNVLFFLHCDSELPPNPIDEIKNVIRTYRWGCFGIAFHSYSIELLVCRFVSNHRIKDRKVVFGDQGIFIQRDLFFEIGMFPSLPIMEDYQLSLTLKARKEKIGLTKHRIYTSPRRFEGDFINRLQIMWKMNRLRSMYRKGIDINKIAKLYKDIR